MSQGGTNRTNENADSFAAWSFEVITFCCPGEAHQCTQGNMLSFNSYSQQLLPLHHALDQIWDPANPRRSTVRKPMDLDHYSKVGQVRTRLPAPVREHHRKTSGALSKLHANESCGELSNVAICHLHLHLRMASQFYYPFVYVMPSGHLFILIDRVSRVITEQGEWGWVVAGFSAAANLGASLCTCVPVLRCWLPHSPRSQVST